MVLVDGRESTLVLDNALTFRVYASDDAGQRSLLSRNLYQGSAWSGAVMPRLEWQVSRTRDVVTTST
jgi:hypothetical protein